MQVIIMAQGRTFTSKRTSDSAETFSHNFMADLPGMKTLRIELEDGSWLVCGPEVVKEAMFKFTP